MKKISRYVLVYFMFHTLEKQAIRQKPKSKKTRTTICEGTIILGHKISKHVQLVSNTKKNPKHHFEFYLYSHSKITT